MSAVNEISHIKDEDLLKKMWQDTEDFGRKKEIRAHMYKLREERLKDLYCSSHVTTNKKTSFNHSMHTDALADHSFASLKRKEIRDSESPTKDNSYIIKGRSSNDGWNVSKIEEHSEDGKSHKFSQSAHRSGSEYIPHGRIDYEAKNNQEVTSFQDGDDKNFIKSKGTSSNSYITQEAVGGDGNSFVRSSTTKSSASSRTVTEQKSTHGDAIDYPKQMKIEIVNDDNLNNFISSDSSKNVTHRNTLVANVGNYQQKGTHYETVGRNVRDDIQSSSNTTKTTTEQKSCDTYAKQLNIPDDIVVDRTTKVYTTDAPKELKTHPGYVEGRTKITRETKTLADGTVVTTTKYETKGVDETRSSSSSNQYVNSSSSSHDNISRTIKSNVHDEKLQTQKVIHDKVPKTQPASRYYVEKTHIIPDTTENIQFDVQSRRDSNISEKRTDSIRNQQSHVEQKYEINTEDRTQNKSTSKNTETDRKQTVHHVNLSNDTNIRKEETIKKEVVDKNKVQQKTIATHDVNSVPLRTPIEIEINLTRMSDNQEKEYITKTKEIPKSESPSYDIPKKRDSIKHESEMTTKTKKTDGQYDTTYRTDYTNKKISIEVSPTHDAFARSLRAVSPDRLSSRTSSRNLKNSTSSLRSSSSPEKTNIDRRLPQRVSPDRYTNGRCYSPSKKLPEKFSSTETITIKKTPSQRMSPEKIQKRKHSTEIKSTTIHSTKITNKNEEETRDQQSPTKNKPRSSIPDDTQRYTNVYEITTDLDDKTSTVSHSTTATDTVKSKVDSEKTKQFFIHDQKRHSDVDIRTTETLKKDRPIDRPLKRSDTYEERCRQILGITGDSNEKRKNSLEKIRKKGSALSLPVDSQPKTPQEKSEESIPSKKVSESPRQKSPTKPLQEYPAQKRFLSESPVKETVSAEIRKSSVGGSPGKDYSSPSRHSPDKQSSPSRNSPKNHPHRKPSSDSQIQEFPSQIRKTAEKYSPSGDETPRNNISRTIDSHKKETSPSTQESYHQKSNSPNKRSPSRSSPKKTKQDEEYHIDMTEEITITQTNEQEDKVNTKNYHLEENIYENSGNETIQRKETVKIDENISNTEDYGDTRKTPEKIMKRANDRDDEKTPTTTTISAKIGNDFSFNSTVKDTKKCRNEKETTTSVSKKQKPSKHKAESDSSSEEESEEIVETQILETTVYDIPRTTSVETSDIKKITKKRIDDNEVFDVNITNIKSFDEDKKTIENRNEETSVNCEITDIYSRKSPHVHETEKPKLLSKHTPSTDESSPSTRKSPKKSTPDDNPDKNSQKPKYQSETQKLDSFIVEHEETSEDIRTDAKETASTVKISRPKDTVNSSKPQIPVVAEGITRPTEKRYPEKTSTSKENIINPTRNTNEIEITTKLIKSEADHSNRKTSIISSEPSKTEPSEIRKSPEKIKPHVDDKESPKPKNIIGKEHFGNPGQDVQTSRQVNRGRNVDETTEFDTTTTILCSIEQQKQFPSNQGSIHKPPSKKTDTTKKLTDDSNRSTHNEKDLRDSLENLENSVHIGIEETIIIESDEEINEEENDQSETLKRYIHIEDNRVESNLQESEHELNEVEFATIKRKPNKQTIINEQPSNKKVPESSTTQKYNKNIKTNVENEQKKVSSVHDTSKQVLVKKTERVPSEKDIKKQTQRTSSSSSLSKKLTTQKKLDIGIIETLKDNSIVKKSQVQKQVKPDTVKQKEMSKEISSRYNRQQIEKKPQEISKKPTANPRSIVPNKSGVGEEIHTKKHVIETYEGKTPVEEPFLTKKTVSLLYSDDEDEKKTTQMFIESEIIETQPIVPETKDKPVKSPKTTTNKLINTEKTQNNVHKPKSSVNPSTKLTKIKHSPVDKKTPNYQQPNKKTLTQTRNTLNTLEDIEILENESVNQIHLRTNRVDEIVNKKKSTSLVDKSPRNGSSVPKTTDQSTPKRPTSRNITITNKNKAQEPKKLQQNPAKSAIPQKQIKSEFEITKTTNIRTTTAPKPKTISRRKEEPVDSDEESLADSLNESVNSSTDDLTDITKRTTEKIIYNENEVVNEDSHEILSSKTSVRIPQDKPKDLRAIPGKTKKYLTRKEIDTERVTVDLQRSISSREATPDKVFPHPVTSDDEETAPRYPDKVVEPDDGTLRKNHNRLFDTSIHEYSDSIQSKKIIEIDENTNQGVSRINRVDNDDESLMTVNKKINKFLSTAEKLTEKPIVDISQPAPKVQRPKFEVNDDLKEDDCLLSVSDKVQKFITEAEYLTLSKDTQHRESINIDVKSDVSDKINQFTSSQTRNDNTTPRKSVTPKDISYSPSIRETEYPDKKQPITITSIDKNKLDQDVFITTECAEIEKESDMFRTSKQSSIPSKEEPIQAQQRTFSDTKSPTKTKKPLAPNESSRQREEVSNAETPFDDTPSKSRKNSLKEFTPKTRRPSQEEKVILSSVSRLRTNESIKKAKAIFDNSESSTRDERRQNDILNRPSVFEGRNRTAKEANTKKVIDRNNVTPKRLDFTAEKKHDEVVRQESTHNLEKQVPSYMKPLNRNTKPKDQPSVPHGNLSEPHQPNKNVDDEQKTVKELNVPGYMKPLDRSHQHTHDSSTLNYQEHTKHSHHKSNSPSDETPGYMKPIDRSHQHNHEITSTIHDTHEHTYVQRHSNDDNHSQYTNDDSIPGYMKPLDRSEHHHPGTYPATEAHRHIVSGSDSHKHYTSMDHENFPRKTIPLEQIHRNSTTTDWRYESRTTKDDTPGYLKPLDRSARPQFDAIDTSKSPDQHGSKYPKHDYEDDGDLPGYMQPLDRSSRPQFDRRETSRSPDRYNQPKRSDEDDGDIPGYMQPLDRSPRPQFDRRETSRSPDRYNHPKRNDEDDDGDIPHYMKPLDRSVPQYESGDRSRSPETDKISSHHPKSAGDQPGYMKPVDRSTDRRRNNSKSPERILKDQKPRFGSPQKDIPAGETPKEIPGTKTKFGVTLKRTNSGKAVHTSKTEKTHPLLLKKQITEEEIDDIYDLEVLEELLLKYTVYEIRRKIRTQIRIVKKLISEGKLEITIKNLRSKNMLTEDLSNSERKDVEENDDVRESTSRTKIQENTTSNRSEIVRKKSYEFSERKVSTSRKESFSSTHTSERLESRRSVSPEKKIPKTNRSTPERSSPERRHPPRQYSDRNIIVEEKSSYQTTQGNKGATTNIVKSNLKKTEPKAKKPTSTAQPEWVTQRNLKKVGTNQVVKKSTVSSSATSKQSTKLRDSTESTDLIASSYGIGPTDENGAPLFGLRALRAQNTNGTTKVQGTVISSEYYSETGKEPVGKISVTKYSSDPRDLGSNDDLTQNGDILSVTTTQKYGYEDTPSLEQLTKTEKEICDSRSNRRKGNSKISTITRKNSVKALTQKFVENAVEETKNERQTSYPKAGLILRSSSFKKESETGDLSYGEESVEERVENSVSVKSSKSISGGTFLRNKSKVTGVQDAISRMKAKDIDYGEAEEDIEAKDLLNKYLGGQVILSGMEKQISSTGSATSTSSFTSAAKSTSRITTVTTENGKEVTKTRTFEHPVSDEVLDTVWDEQTLRYLLEQSTDYEERKRIRARLRVIMAEQEACTELVKQASQDQSSQSIDEKIETSKEVVTEGPVTTTKVTRVSTQQHVSKKPMSPFAKFRQLDKQNSLNTPPSTPRTPGGSPIFKFTDAALSQSASTIKDRLLYWCRMKTKEYENIQLDNFSSSWADGLAFCALIHHFLPDAFDYHALTPKERRHNFSLAFKVADEKADIAPLLDVDDMVATMRPDWKCVFTYVQSIYRRFKDED